MWLKKKKIDGRIQTFLRPQKVESIRILDYPSGQGDGGYFSIRIDGVEYSSFQKLNFPSGTGICFLESPGGKRYYCDDSIIIAALSRFWITYSIKLIDRWPKRGYELPLLSRIDSRKYLKLHLIPHPGVGW